MHSTLKCNHANLIEAKTLVGGENEFLYAPYSVFTVDSVDFKTNPTWIDPHRVVLQVAPDNKLEAGDLPLAPWA